MNDPRARTLAVLGGGTAALAGALTGLFLLREASDIDLDVLAWLGWAVGPFALFVLLAWIARRSAAAGGVVLVGVLACAAFGAWAIHDAFQPPREALAGLVFLVLPLYQGAALGACAAGVGVILWRSRARGPR
ncbi:MAG TPA: hypothetical protein VEJ18_13110 [Planctomycetota bacterium]|nr:hypothetical protein [Planctomycetota bacterium]